jgi:hypothetical protein
MSSPLSSAAGSDRQRGSGASTPHRDLVALMDEELLLRPMIQDRLEVPVFQAGTKLQSCMSGRNDALTFIQNCR